MADEQAVALMSSAMVVGIVVEVAIKSGDSLDDAYQYALRRVAFDLGPTAIPAPAPAVTVIYREATKLVRFEFTFERNAQ